MSYSLVAQAIGIIAVLISLSVYQSNRRAGMLGLAMVAALFYATHFFMLGALTGAAMNLIGAARSFVFMRIRPSKRRTWILWMFLGLAGVATLITWHGPISLLALTGTICSALSSWQRSARMVRRFAVATPFPWFLYSAASGSYPGMAIELLTLVSNLYGQYRHDMRRKLRWPLRLPHRA